MEFREKYLRSQREQIAELNRNWLAFEALLKPKYQTPDDLAGKLDQFARAHNVDRSAMWHCLRTRNAVVRPETVGNISLNNLTQALEYSRVLLAEATLAQ